MHPKLFTITTLYVIFRVTCWVISLKQKLAVLNKVVMPLKWTNHINTIVYQIKLTTFDDKSNSRPAPKNSEEKNGESMMSIIRQ